MRSAAAGPISPTPPLARIAAALNGAGSSARPQADRCRGQPAARRHRRYDCSDKLLVFLTRRDAEPTNNEQRAGTEALGDLPQSDERVPLRMGREDLRRPLLNCRHRPPHRPERSHRHPRRPGTTRSPGSRRAPSAHGVSNYSKTDNTSSSLISFLSRLSQTTSVGFGL